MTEPFGYFKAEPFGWTDCAETDEGAVALYEHPRKWIGLTHEDKVRILANDFGGNRLDCMDAAERILKEKNHV